MPQLNYIALACTSVSIELQGCPHIRIDLCGGNRLLRVNDVDDGGNDARAEAYKPIGRHISRAGGGGWVGRRGGRARPCGQRIVSAFQLITLFVLYVAWGLPRFRIHSGYYYVAKCRKTFERQ